MLLSTHAARSRTPRRAGAARLRLMVVAWQVVAVALVVLVGQGRWWSIVAAGAVLLVALVLSLPVNGRTLPASLRIRRAFRRRKRLVVAATEQAPELVPLTQWLPRLALTQIRDAHDTEIGVVADGGAWTGVLEVTADDALFADGGALLDLAGLTALTSQDDVLFAGIQVVTFTVPAPSGAMLPAGSPALDAYRGIVADATPPAVRRTWIALRLDPRLCLEAVERRGSGEVGVFATLRFGLHRAQALLKRGGVATRPLDTDGIAEALALTTLADDAGASPRSREAWDVWVGDGLVHQSRAVEGLTVDPSAAYQQLLDVSAGLPAMAVVTSLTITPGDRPRGALRLVAPDRDEAARAGDALAAGLHTGLRTGRPGGVQVPGLVATVPLGRNELR